MAGESCMGAESLGWLWGQDEPPMKGGAKFPVRKAGLIWRVVGRVYRQMRRVRRRFPGVAVLIILVWDVA